MLREQTFNTGTLAINYAEGPPSGPPLVLLHGGGDRWQEFWPILPILPMRAYASRAIQLGGDAWN
jgi:pimeloyl-ACP methyl ester carboxylesterase